MSGKVVLVGAGPGDPGLLTVRGRALLEKADVVVTDALVNPRIWQGLKARILDVGKRGPGAPHGAHQRASQTSINQILVRLAKQGKTVVRLKGGDPFVFGRGSEELEALKRAGVSFEVVPGVSSAHAVPAYAGIPITDRRFASHVTFLTGHEKGDSETEGNIDWQRLSPQGTLVVLMGVSRWPDIQRQLLAHGWPGSHPVAAIESGSTPHQRVLHTQLKQAARDFSSNRLQAPAIIVVGHVARLGKKLDWFQKNRPLSGARVVVMRPVDQALDLVEALEAKGAEVLNIPLLKINSLARTAAVHRQVRALNKQENSFDYLIFLSANAVRCFEEVAPSLAKKWRHAAVAVVGQQTARVAKEYGWRVSFQPKATNAMGVAAVLGKLNGKHCLIPRAQVAPDTVLKTLRNQGASVTVLPIYKTERIVLGADEKRQILSTDFLIFTSTSMVEAFGENLSKREIRQLIGNARFVSIGSQTSSALKKIGIKKFIEARSSSVAALVQAVLRK